MSDVVIDIKDVHKIYQTGSVEVAALRGITFQVQRGEFWAIMGSSGSGKSTLLNLLGCLDHPTHGQYLLDDCNVAGLDDGKLSDFRLSKLGFIFQSFNLIPQLSVQENIELPLYYQAMEASDSASQALRLAEMVGLTDRLLHRPSELSGGQRQRVAIARALANEPAVILADEPTGNLDTETGDQIMDILDGLHHEGRTIVMVTHEPEIAAHATHHMHMRDGQIFSMGPVNS